MSCSAAMPHANLGYRCIYRLRRQMGYDPSHPLRLGLATIAPTALGGCVYGDPALGGLG